MANAGFNSDCKLIKKAILSGKCLNINDTDNSVEVSIKTMINNLVLKDEIVNKTYGGNIKHQYHSSWGKMYKVLIRINQLRLKNWFFNPIS